MINKDINKMKNKESKIILYIHDIIFSLHDNKIIPTPNIKIMTDISFHHPFPDSSF